MSRLTAEHALPAPLAARQRFDQAAATFETACVVHDYTRARLLERLPLVQLTPRTILDLGCATGRAGLGLSEQYPKAQLIGVDTSLAMLERARIAAPYDTTYLAADAEQLPLGAACIDLVFANLVLPWTRPERLFGEVARVLADGGLFVFATLGPDSLKEVRRAWAAADDQIHVHAFFDMHDLGDLTLAAGLLEPVIDVERIELSYLSLGALVHDLRSCGAANVAAGRRRGLTGPRRWAGFERALGELKHNSRFGVTMELVFGQVWGGQGAGPGQEVAVPLSRIRRRRS